MTPLTSQRRISVLLEAGVDSPGLSEAIRSVLSQTYTDWELVIAVGPGITDALGSFRGIWSHQTGGTSPATIGESALNQGRAGETPAPQTVQALHDPRIKVVSVPDETGPAARLNLAARAATGELIAYLDGGAEFYPDFLRQVRRLPRQADVAVFGCDVTVPDSNGSPTVVAWSPATIRAQLFVRNIASRIGIVHSRELFERAGGLNELLCGGSEWDLLKRFARLGAEFLFPTVKAGKCRARVSAPVAELARVRVGSDGLNSAESSYGTGKAGPTDWQFAQIEKNRRDRKPVFGVRAGGMLPKQVKRVLFVCAECVLDYTNGASLAVLHAMRWMNANGFVAEALCVCVHAGHTHTHTHTQSADQLPAARTLARSAPAAATSESQADSPRSPSPPTPLPRGARGEEEGSVWQTIAAGIPVTVRQVEKNDPWRVTGDTRKFLEVYERLLNEQRPDVVVTYGGDCLSLALMEATKFRDIPIVFWLHNFSYPDRNSFQFADRVIVPSDFSRDYHWQSLGLDCHTIPNFIDWPRVKSAVRKPRYVTFVNPGPYKGVFVFAAIAERLAAVRPDISLLVVAGRTSYESLETMGLDLKRFANVHTMPATADPREFYAVTKLLLMPSLWNESFGLVAVEAMINGIPVLASNRGALPEIVGHGGDLFEIPEQYTPETRTVPTAAEIQPWVDRIIRLWDDPVEYLEASQRAHARAQTWHPDRIGPLYQKFFANMSPQPAPPIVPW